MLRGSAMCQMKLNDSSIFCTSDTAVYSSRAKPTEPSTPTFMRSTNSMMYLVISSPWGPSGASNLRSAGATWLCTPKALSTEKLSASSGTIDSSVVYTRLMARSVSSPDSQIAGEHLRQTREAQQRGLPARQRVERRVPDGALDGLHERELFPGHGGTRFPVKVC